MSGAAFSDAELDRYARHIILPQIGGAGQAALKAAHVAVIGAGGIGCPVIQYLSAAGVGTLTIIDDDRVELSNLQRQILFADADLGAAKAEAAAVAARGINPHIRAHAVSTRIDAANAAALLNGTTLVVDGCDNFATRLAVNAGCMAAQIPLLSAAIGAFDAQVGAFEGWRTDQPCYACLVGGEPARDGINCAEAGVLGALAGLAGTLAATEAIRAIAGFGTPLTGRLAILDMFDRRWREVRVAKDPGCPICRT
jgi:molybdopterin-synthase adenylyltransferase